MLSILVAFLENMNFNVITPIILTENSLNLKEEAKSFCKVQAIETLK